MPKIVDRLSDTARTLRQDPRALDPLTVAAVLEQGAGVLDATLSAQDVAAQAALDARQQAQQLRQQLDAAGSAEAALQARLTAAEAAMRADVRQAHASCEMCDSRCDACPLDHLALTGGYLADRDVDDALAAHQQALQRPAPPRSRVRSQRAVRVAEAAARRALLADVAQLVATLDDVAWSLTWTRRRRLDQAVGPVRDRLQAEGVPA